MSKRVTTSAIASAWLSQSLHIVFYRETFHLYDGLRYRPTEEGGLANEINAFITAFLGAETATAKFVESVVRTIQHRTWVPGELNPTFRLSGQPTENALSLQNGTLFVDRLVAGTVNVFDFRHDPDLFTINTLPFEYDPAAKSPRWDSFLQWLSCDDRGIQDLLQDFAGWCLLPALRLEQFLWLTGPGDNGKSTFAAVLRHVLGGDGAVSALSLSQLKSNSFEIGATVGRRLNIVEEVRKRELVDEASIKRFASQYPFSLNRKFKQVIEVVPTARLLILTNHFPYLHDTSQAIWKRLLLVHCRATIEPWDKDIQLEKKLVSEASGILNWLLAGAKRVTENEAITEPPSVVAAVRREKRDADATATFVEETVVWTDEESDWLTDEALYNEYQEWMDKNGHGRPKSITNFK